MHHRTSKIQHTEITSSQHNERIESQETYSFTNIAIAGNDGDFTSQHNISSTLDAVYKRFTASIVVVKFGLGNRVINIDGRDLEPTLPESLVEVVNTGGGFLRNTLDIYGEKDIRNIFALGSLETCALCRY